MSVKKDYKEEKVMITGDIESDYPYPLYCTVSSADSDYPGKLLLRDGATGWIHICRDAASELLPILQRYVDTGKVVEPEYRVGTASGGYIICNPKGEQVCEVCFSRSQSAEEICDALNRVTRGEGEKKWV